MNRIPVLGGHRVCDEALRLALLEVEAPIPRDDAFDLVTDLAPQPAAVPRACNGAVAN
jgi:hypothetical protein